MAPPPMHRNVSFEVLREGEGVSKESGIKSRRVKAGEKSSLKVFLGGGESIPLQPDKRLSMELSIPPTTASECF